MNPSPLYAELDRLCEVMHDAYEKAAARQGWETQERSRKPWSDVPEANRATMREAVIALLVDLQDHGRMAKPKPEPYCQCGGPANHCVGPR